MSNLSNRNHWSTLLVTAGYLAATLTGFLRQSALAFYLGAGRETDIFLVAFSIPEFFFIALPVVLSPVIIPLFARVRQQAGEAAAARLALRLLLGYSVFFLASIAVLWLLAPVYIAWLSPGFNPAERAGALAAARQMLPAVLMMGCGALVGAILQVYRSFARPAFVTAVYNLVFVAGLLLLPAPAIERAGWSVVLGSLAAVLVQVPMLAALLFPSGSGGRADRAASGREDVNGTASFGQAAALMLPFAAGYGAHHIILLVDRAMATTLGWGDAAAISYARNLSLVIVQLSGLAVATVMFPGLAEQMDQTANSRARTSLSAALRWVWALALPAAAGMVVLREPLVRFLLERGAFDRSATNLVSLLLIFYSFGALADALCQPLWRVIYARGSPWTVLWVNGLQTSVRITANLALVSWMGTAGLALSAAVGLALQALVLAWLALDRLKVQSGRLASVRLLKEAGAVLIAASLAAASAGLLSTVLRTSFSAAWLLAASGGAGAAVYGVLMWLSGSARSIWHGIKTI